MDFKVGLVLWSEQVLLSSLLDTSPTIAVQWRRNQEITIYKNAKNGFAVVP